LAFVRGYFLFRQGGGLNLRCTFNEVLKEIMVHDIIFSITSIKNLH